MNEWRTQLISRADELERSIRDLDGDVTSEEREILQADLDAARRRFTAARESSAWRAGNVIDDSWAALHRLEERTDEWSPLQHVLVTAEDHIQRELPKSSLEEMRAELKLTTSHAEKRAIAVGWIRRAHETAEGKHHSERDFQRGTVWASGVLLVLGAVCVAVAVVYSDDPFLTLPKDAALPGWALLLVTMLFGMVGGAVSALTALYTGANQFKDTRWFDPRPTLALAKIALGMWTAVLGVLFVGSGIVEAVYGSVAAVVLLSLVFGFSQQLVTTFVDKWARKVLVAP